MAGLGQQSRDATVNILRVLAGAGARAVSAAGAAFVAAPAGVAGDSIFLSQVEPPELRGGSSGVGDVERVSDSVIDGQEMYAAI